MTISAGSRERRDESDAPGVPRWVKVSGIVTVIVAVVLIVIVVMTGGEHGPGRHTGASTSVPMIVGTHGAGMW